MNNIRTRNRFKRIVINICTHSTVPSRNKLSCMIIYLFFNIFPMYLCPRLVVFAC